MVASNTRPPPEEMRLFNGVEALPILFVLVWVTGLFSALRSVGGGNAGLCCSCACRPWVPKTQFDRPHAALLYSWMSPPRTSRRQIRSRVSTVAESRRVSLTWRLLLEGAVWAMRVVVLDLGREDALEVTSVHDQEPVEALATGAADPAFGERVRVRRPQRCADRPDARGCRKLGAACRGGVLGRICGCLSHVCAGCFVIFSGWWWCVAVRMRRTRSRSWFCVTS